MQQKSGRLFLTKDEKEATAAFLRRELQSFKSGKETTLRMIASTPIDQLSVQLQYYSHCVACCQKMLSDLGHIKEERVEENAI